ncbi:MAG: aminotransferase class I/II-fold pyridoxal phosphate-dependent enzyme [bacterium]|nr:aminotransferase class I/II-fold pyridoxal phosphate-dependent enzyme [bacterium]
MQGLILTAGKGQRLGEFTHNRNKCMIPIHGKTVIERALDNLEVDVLVLVNPDNPSGHFLPKDDILELLEYLHMHGKMLILDESFLDFAESGASHSLLQSDSLRAYSSALLIIKSLSKSYGVPGLRLY